MWTLIIFKYMLYRLSMNRFLYSKLKFLIKSKKIKCFSLQISSHTKKKRSIRQNKVNSNKCLLLINKSLSLFKCSYFKTLLKVYLSHYYVKNLYLFTKNIYKEYNIFDLLIKKESHYFFHFKNINSLNYLSNVDKHFCNYQKYIPIDSHLDRLYYYSSLSMNCSYIFSSFLERYQSENWFDKIFNSTKEYEMYSFYLKHFILFFSNLIYFKNYIIYSKNRYLRKVILFNPFLNSTFYFLNLYDFTLNYNFFYDKIHFSGNLEYYTDILNIMFYDDFLLNLPRIWYSHSYTLLLKAFINKYIKQKIKKLCLMYLLNAFYDIEYTQSWLYKMYEDKAFAFYGYGDIIVKHKLETKLETLDSPSFNSLDYVWASNSDLSDLIVLKQSPFLNYDYLFIGNKKSYYNY